MSFEVVKDSQMYHPTPPDAGDKAAGFWGGGLAAFLVQFRFNGDSLTDFRIRRISYPPTYTRPSVEKGN